VVSAPPGSGKTTLLRSWISQGRRADRAAWVAAGQDERDPRRFWTSVLGALRQTGPGAVLVQDSSAAPDLDGRDAAERLLKDLAPLADLLWLVIDDVHELDSDALAQLEMLLLRAPATLRFVLASRHDVRLGLHRLRLEGDLAEIRADDLRFTVSEARELLAGVGVKLPGSVLESMHKRTEGWAAGLRLAALSLAGYPDPERFAAEFSGSERTVAEYLLVEVLDRQPAAVRRLLLRTSVLERVNGELADLLTGDEGGERILQDLEQSNAFVVSLDAARTWFRYHQMFADLLAMELRRTAPQEVTALYQAASGWLAAHGYPVEAIRHAQAAQDWGLATRLLVDHWPGLYLDGQAITCHELLARFPPHVRAADAGLAAVAAADQLAHGSVEAAERYLGLAERGMASLPGARSASAPLVLGIVRLLLARQRGDLPATAAAQWLQVTADVRDAAQPGLGEDLRVLALTGLGNAGYWIAQPDEAEQQLEQGIALARRIGRPFLEFTGLAHLAAVESSRSYARAAEHGRQAIELAEQHGWTGEQAADIASIVLGGALTWQGRLEEAEPWVQRAEHAVKAEAQPMLQMGACLNRGVHELGSGRNARALAAFRVTERLSGLLPSPSPVITVIQALQVQALVFLGQAGYAEQVLATLAERDRERGEICIATAGLRLVQDGPDAALTVLGPVLDYAAQLPPAWRTQAFLLEAIARDTLGDPGMAGRALERALDMAEPDGVLLPFLLYPAPALIERHIGHRTAHAALTAQIRGLLARTPLAPPAGPQSSAEPLSAGELRVLRYLPTNLTASELARELSVSPNTIKTHMRHLYAKLGTHRRAEAVTRARDLGLLASPRTQRPRV
jgi:LuxR family maltose regulon positive regulatory protein